VDVGIVAGQGPGDRADDRAQRRLVVDDVAPGQGLAERRRVVDVGLDEAGARIHVGPLAGGEVVEHDHVVAPRQEGVDEVGADEAGAPGDQGPIPRDRHLSSDVDLRQVSISRESGPLRSSKSGKR
jgi:hypothetical protein